jgi:hypothetical protein
MVQTFLSGQQNLAGLSVPGVYGDIILPTPFIVGTPTNIEGLVGVGSWGPVGTLIPATATPDASLSIGPPTIRPYDIATHIEAATQVGGAIGFMCVRVTDGTDTAASAAISTGGVQATGSVTFSAQPVSGSSVTFNSVAYTFSAANLGANLAATLAIMLAQLQGSADASLDVATYSLVNGNTIDVLFTAAGTAGNAYTLAASTSPASNATVSGATLTGGSGSGGTGVTLTAAHTGILGNGIEVTFEQGTNANTFMAVVNFPGLPPQMFNNVGGTGNAFWVNLAAAINNGNSFGGPSTVVIASAGSSTAAPTLGVTTTLTGGTDGASGVTDQTLVGTNTVPRKGMFVMQNAGIDCFTLIDITTTSIYASEAAFALSQQMMAIQAGPNGQSISAAISIVQTAGLDTPWFWYILGDYPSFNDAANGVTRVVNPTAFAIGIVGNLSPQESPLNKPLQGVTSTFRSTLGQPYSDTELSEIELGGIDTILPSTQSPGGFYYSFASGRNTSSNTAANGVEYTRLTNFLMTAVQSKAAGSFVGQLQSIQNDDPTRAAATQLFNGFSAQLASPQFGVGGLGIIDTPWEVQCNLANNPPLQQAQGYLFLYWAVRYLNVIRYFVVQFQGGGNVVVTVSASSPVGSTISLGATATGAIS